MTQPTSEIVRRLRDKSPGWVTYAILQICILLFFFARIEAAETDIPEPTAIAHWGGLGNAFELWKGGWWRLWTTTLHHGDFFHLLFNMWALAFLGKILERRLPSWQYILFILGAAGFSGTAQAFFNPHFVGFSGVLCAFLGWIISQRDSDPELAERFPETSVWISLGILLGMIPLSLSDTYPIANIAHFAGLLYGVAIGRWCHWKNLSSTQRLKTALTLLALHALLIPAVWYTSHPTWEGRYYWAQADRTRDITTRRQLWKQALQLDPSLIELDFNLAHSYANSQDWLSAWEWILKGLHTSPADPDMISLARDIGAHLIRDGKQEKARDTLRAEFGNQSPWETKLLTIGPTPDPLPATPLERLKIRLLNTATEGEPT